MVISNLPHNFHSGEYNRSFPCAHISLSRVFLMIFQKNKFQTQNSKTSKNVLRKSKLKHFQTKITLNVNMSNLDAMLVGNETITKIKSKTYVMLPYINLLVGVIGYILVTCYGNTIFTKSQYFYAKTRQLHLVYFSCYNKKK